MAPSLPNLPCIEVQEIPLASIIFTQLLFTHSYLLHCLFPVPMTYKILENFHVGNKMDACTSEVKQFDVYNTADIEWAKAELSLQAWNSNNARLPRDISNDLAVLGTHMPDNENPDIVPIAPSETSDENVEQISNMQNKELHSRQSYPNDQEENVNLKVQRKSLTSFGSVMSPFFFLCHYPRPGEHIGAGREEVTVKVKLSGSEDPSQGYVPHAMYQVLVASNVLFDGFMLTGVHALTKDIAETNYINLPASLHGGTSEGLVCAVLHSHISHKPRRQLSFLWMAPPVGTGCVSFLAQGSLGEELIFKDLPVLEVCEKENDFGELKQARSVLAGRDLPGLIFRDDFEDPELGTAIWYAFVFPASLLNF
ncbi:hypothetical protein SK128_027758 [Halocaridina rubra]|uniref:Reelin domain-containing protein n=1 Tax=Halocaridina rubra TaxID=373956 RepID=A0AAN9A9Q6_HALRR